MSLQKLIKQRMHRITHVMHYQEGLSKSKISYLTGLHYYVVEDVLNQMKIQDKVYDDKGLWYLKNKEEKGGKE